MSISLSRKERRREEKMQRKTEKRQGSASQLSWAIEKHQSGDFVEAKKGYQSILSKEKNHPDALHLLGIICEQMGDSKEAISLIKQAIKSQKQFPQAHYNLGNVLAKLNKHEQAIASFTTAIQQNPDDLKAYYNRGNSAFQLENYEAAKTDYENILQKDPSNESVMNNLATTLVKLGHRKDGIELHRKAIALNPNQAEFYNNLAIALIEEKTATDEALRMIESALKIAPQNTEFLITQAFCYQEKNESAKSIDIYQRVLNIDPKNPKALDNLGMQLERKGEINEAIECYQKVLKTSPRYINAYLNLSNVFGDKTILQFKEKLEAIALDEKLSENEQITLQFSLGKTYEKEKSYAKAFKAYQKGNELKKSALGYHDQIMEDRYQAIKAAFTEDFIQENLLKDENEIAPVFILSLPRSGSTLLENILSAHTELDSAGESSATLYSLYENQLINENSNPIQPNINYFTLMNTRDDILDKIKKITRNEMNFVEKSINNIELAGFLAILFPKAKFIHIARNPLETCWSCYKQLFREPLGFIYDFEDLAKQYHRHEDLLSFWEPKLNDRLMNITYEDLVSDTENTAKATFEFLGLSWEPECLNFHKKKSFVTTASKSQVRQSIYQTSIKNTDHYQDELAALVKALEQ